MDWHTVLLSQLQHLADTGMSWLKFSPNILKVAWVGVGVVHLVEMVKELH